MSLVVSNHHKYIFFHLPKNAGVSVSRILIAQENNLQFKRIGSYIFRKLFKTQDNFYFSLRHKKMKFFSSHIPCYKFQDIIEDKIFSSYLKFAVVRNPWDRMVSRYFYSKKIDNKFNNFDFDTFLDYDFLNNLHTVNQYKFCSDKNENFCLNQLIKFENINNDFNKISSQLFNKKDMLVHLNKSDHNYYREYYNNKTKDKVYKFCKKDIEFFEYEF